jgi:hypothetical protein
MSMPEFAQIRDSPASLVAQKIVYIYENQLILKPRRVANDEINKAVEFITRAERELTYPEKIKKRNDKIRYHYFEKEHRSKLANTAAAIQSFDAKSRVLADYKSNIANPLSKFLSEAEKRGEIRPSYDVWMKVLWFLPDNCLLYMFDAYEKICEDTITKRNHLRKTDHSLSCKQTNNSTEIFKAMLESSTDDVKNKVIFNDVVYICEKLLPLLLPEVLPRVLPRVLPAVAGSILPKVLPMVLTSSPVKIAEPMVETSVILDSWEDFDM